MARYGCASVALRQATHPDSATTTVKVVGTTGLRCVRRFLCGVRGIFRSRAQGYRDTKSKRESLVATDSICRVAWSSRHSHHTLQCGPFLATTGALAVE